MTTKEFINKILDLKIVSSIDIDYAKNSMDLYLGNTPLLYIEYFRQYYFILEGNVLSKCPKEKIENFIDVFYEYIKTPVEDRKNREIEPKIDVNGEVKYDSCIEIV